MTALIVGTNHVGFTVSDMDRAIGMFTDLFGYTVVSRAPRPSANVERVTGVQGADIVVAHLRQPNMIGIELTVYSAPAERTRVQSRPCDTGFSHLTLDVSDLDAVVAAADKHRLRPMGEPITSVDGPNKGGRAIFLRDPDGITIELIQPARFAKPGA